MTGEYRDHIAVRYANNYQERKRGESLCTTLEDEYGDLPAEDFGPRKLGELRDLFVASGNCRKYANRLTRNVINVFRHAVSRELIDVHIVERLKTLEPLRYGQTKAPESKEVEAVDIEAVRLTAQHLSPTLRAMVRVQAATGMRSGELCILRPMDIERRDDGVWLYTVSKHKTTYRGKKKTIPLVGDAKAALKPFLDRPGDACCFSPAESLAWYVQQRRAKRKSKVQPSQIDRSKPNPKKKPRERFYPDSYRRAIAEAAKKAGTDHWHPHQLRHTAASVIREALGLDHVQSLWVTRSERCLTITRT